MRVRKSVTTDIEKLIS